MPRKGSKKKRKVRPETLEGRIHLAILRGFRATILKANPTYKAFIRRRQILTAYDEVLEVHSPRHHGSPLSVVLNSGSGTVAVWRHRFPLADPGVEELVLKTVAEYFDQPRALSGGKVAAPKFNMPKVVPGPGVDHEFKRRHLEAVAQALREDLAPWEVMCVGGSTSRNPAYGHTADKPVEFSCFLHNGGPPPLYEPGHRWIVVKTEECCLDVSISFGEMCYGVSTSLLWMPCVRVPIDEPGSLDRLSAGIKAMGDLIGRAAHIKRFDDQLKSDAAALRGKL